MEHKSIFVESQLPHTKQYQKKKKRKKWHLVPKARKKRTVLNKTGGNCMRVLYVTHTLNKLR